MKAVVLAAGGGSRLGGKRPKCMTLLAGKPLLHWQLDALRAVGIERISVVVGDRAEEVDTRGFARITNHRYSSTNMVESLFCAAARIEGDDADTLVTYGDLVFDVPALAAIVGADPAPISTLVGRRWHELWARRFPDPLTDAETLRLDGDRVVEIGQKPSRLGEIEGQYVGATRITRAGFSALGSLRRELHDAGGWRGDESITDLLQIAILGGLEVRAAFVDSGWLEVDTPEDLALYERVVAGELLPGWIEWPP